MISESWIIEQIEETENQIFYLNMKDKFTNDDLQLLRTLETQLTKLKKDLEEF